MTERQHPREGDPARTPNERKGFKPPIKTKAGPARITRLEWLLGLPVESDGLS